MSAIVDVLWPGLKALAPASELGGILARKPGYHNSRDHLPPTDYSVAEFAIDRMGPADEGSAIDWTFPNAQAGDFATIARFSRLLLAAGRAGDPRAYPMREFFGNADGDRQVDGWDFAKRRPSSSDSSHLWHIHISIHRKYIDDPAAMRSILSILSGSVPATPPPVPTPVPVLSRTEKIMGSLPVLRLGAKSQAVGRLQALLNTYGARLGEDDDFGPATDRAVRSFQMTHHLGVDGVAGPSTWASLLGVA